MTPASIVEKFVMPDRTEIPRNQFISCPVFFVIDVESIGLYGPPFAVAGGIYNLKGKPVEEFRFSISRDSVWGFDAEDRKWVDEHVPHIPITHNTLASMQKSVISLWSLAKEKYPGIQMAVECGFPVEANFLSAAAPLWSKDAPYPLLEISTYMQAAGLDPLATYTRLESEQPAHHPLADARLSARLLATSIQRLCPIEQ